jgi:hypothetical protein
VALDGYDYNPPHLLNIELLSETLLRMKKVYFVSTTEILGKREFA